MKLDPAFEPNGTMNTKPIAILVCHGMGRQVPFEELNDVALALGAASTSDVRFVDLLQTQPGDELKRVSVARAEVTLTLPGGTKQDVHLFEAYWAPLTEGVIGLAATLGFLLKAALLGIRYGGSHFSRQAFGRTQRYPVGWLTRVQVLGITLAVLTLLVTSAAYLAVVSTEVISLLGYSYRPDLMTFVRAQLYWFLQPLWVCAILLGVGLLLQRFLPKILKNERWRETIAIALYWGLIWAPIIALVLSGTYGGYYLAKGVFYTLRQGFAPPFLPGAVDPHVFTAYPMLMILVGALLLFLRYFTIQYLGDVAIYLSAQTLSRFASVRESIQKECFALARSVYDAQHGDSYVYERILVVAHSLGSVIAYDTLNALTRWDLVVRAGTLRVADRTSLFLTYGSPLDKVAFFFRYQTGGAMGWLVESYSEFREMRSGAHQPLISNYDPPGIRRYRPRCWINIYAPPDWFSGSLNYYDDRSSPGQAGRVCNIEESELIMPVYAHVQYMSKSRARLALQAAVAGDTALAAFVTSSRRPSRRKILPSLKERPPAV